MCLTYSDESIKKVRKSEMFSPTGLKEAGCHEFYSCKKVDSDNNHRSLTEDLELQVKSKSWQNYYNLGRH